MSSFCVNIFMPKNYKANRYLEQKKLLFKKSSHKMLVKLTPVPSNKKPAVHCPAKTEMSENDQYNTKDNNQ